MSATEPAGKRRGIKRPALARGQVKDACLAQALQIIEEHGLGALSLRDVSRRLGVSYQAPYKHFENRDAILAELLTRCFGEFAAHLEAKSPSGNAAADLQAMGEAYFDYAQRFPTKYRLMFETPMPEPASHPEMMAAARHAFALLRQRLAAIPVPSVGPPDTPTANLDALFVWSVVHGLSTIMNGDTITTLGLSDWERHQAAAHALSRISISFGFPLAGADVLKGDPPR
jgi:AcrR family transcriptional regulator